MSREPNDDIERLCSGCNRIVVTTAPFDPKNKKRNSVLADIRDAQSIRRAKDTLLVDPDSCTGSWMSPVDVYLGFLSEKCLIGSIGVVLGSWLRSPDWAGDFAVKSDHAFRRWLLEHGVADGSASRIV